MGQTIALDASTVLACSELGEQGANDVLISASNVLEAVDVSMHNESNIVSSLVYKRATCQCAVCTVVWDAFTHIVVAMAKWSKYRLAEEFDTVWALLHRAVASVVAADRLVVDSAFCDLGTLRQMFDDGLRRSKHDAENVWPSDSLIGGSSMRTCRATTRANQRSWSAPLS